MTTAAPGQRALLALCAGAVAFAAIDTYVVVLALPDMMASVGIGVDELQRAAPIISGFLLGYVAILPLIGRVADLRGPVPVIAASLVTFAIGSLITAAGYDLPSMVAGRFLQGVGGGGLVPATMALVAALYPPEQRGVPLGLISAVQEIGSVLGPLVGAAVLAVASWRGIFLLNAAGGIALYLAVRVTRQRGDIEQPTPERPARTGPPDLIGALALLLLLVSTYLTVEPPRSLRLDLTYGELFLPVIDGATTRWLWPVGLVAIGSFAVLAVRSVTAARPVIDVRPWARSLAAADLRGALLLAAALAGIVLAFATADPAVAVFSPQGPWFLAGSVIATVLLVRHLRTATDPLVPRGALNARPAWGALVVSLLVGWALIAALVDIPLFARTTVYPDSQLDAALVLLRFLVALPIGAVVGGLALRHLPAGVIAAAGMLLAALGFFWMSTWDVDALEHASAWVPLVTAGLGFGLALAPVNAAVLASTREDTHGLASALVVVARMVGMLVGISALTTLGLRRLNEAREATPSLTIKELGVLQEQAVFAGAAWAALLAAVLALVLLRGAATRGQHLGRVIATGG